MVSQGTKKGNTLRERKRASLAMAERLYDIGYRRRAERMKNCFSRVDYAISPAGEDIRITQTYLCRDRLCSICAAGLARKRWWQMLKAAEVSNNWDGKPVAMLTLTVRNCSAFELAGTLRAMSRAFKRLFQRAVWVDAVAGWARQTEVTYNPRTGLHPHIHLLLILHKRPRSLDRLGSSLAAEWKDAMRLNYNPVYHTEYTYAKKRTGGNVAFIEAYAEASKYMCKPLQILQIEDTAELAAVVSALSGVRMASYGGCVKEARRRALIKDEDNLDVVDITINPAEIPADYIRGSAKWAMGAWVDIETKKIIRGL